jgi:hypothetical protein
MSINTIKGPLIQPNVNNDNNTTRIMEVDTLYSNTITDGIATIEDGYISNLINPTAGNEIATKFYVDNSGGGSGAIGPNTSIQYNSAGSFAGSANLTLTNPNSPLATLNINGDLTNGTMTLSGTQFSGLDNPTNPQEAATKNYVDQSVNTLGVITVDTLQPMAIIYTPAEVYNNIINIQFNPDNIFAFCAADSLPFANLMKTFLGTDFVIGKSWLTIFAGPTSNNELFIKFLGVVNPITYYYCSLALPYTIITNYSYVTILSVVTDITPGSEKYSSYVSSIFNNVTTNAQITDQGLLTPSLGNGALLGTGTIVYPVPNDPSINSAVPIAYTYSNLKQYLVVRTGLIANTSDSFIPAAAFVTDNDFTMGGGTFKFFIQNPTVFDLTLVPSLGWSFQAGSSDVIPAGYCGAFWVTVTISPAACKIISMGINPING